jgi:hypothetical protein
MTPGGDGCQSIFGSDDDRLDFLALLAEAKRRFNWLWKDLVAGIYLGSEQWRAQIQKRIDGAPRSDEHPKGWPGRRWPRSSRS